MSTDKTGVPPNRAQRRAGAESENFTRPGAVDLSGLASTAPAAPPGVAPGAPASGPSPAPPAAASPGGVVIDVTDATFQAQVLQQSMTVPVVIDFWAEWCGPCKQLSPTLEKLAAEYGGRFILAKIDVDANQQIAAQAQVQSIPTVLGVVKGQAIPLFQGALPEAQVRQYLDQLLQVAEANGVNGRVTADPGAAPADPPHDPRFDQAYEAIERGDLEVAAAAYRDLLADAPADAEAKAGLAQVELMRRTAGADASSAIADADAKPADVPAQLAAADLELVAGQVEPAFDRLIRTVRVVSGDDRDAARTRLIELFEIVGQSDPRVAKARTALASALF